MIKTKSTAYMGLALLASLGTALPAGAEGQPAPTARQAMAVLDFDIPALPLADALTEFGKQTGLHMVMDAQLGVGRNAGWVKGRYRPEEALQRLLRNTGLGYEYLDERTIVLDLAGGRVAPDSAMVLRPTSIWLAQAPAAAAARDGDDSAQATVHPGAHVDEAGGETIEQIIIRGARISTAMKMDVPLLTVPQNIQVLSAGFVEDIGAGLLEDVLRHVAGVAVGGNFNGWDYFRIRGFSGISYLDGMRTDSLALNAELFGIDRLEVIKGPASLHGEGLISGMVNIVSKRPTREAFVETSLKIGEDNYAEAAGDLGGALNEAGTLYGRLPMVHRQSGTFVEHADGLTRTYLAPALTWDVGEQTHLTMLTSYQKDENELALPLPAAGTVLPNVNGRIPHDRFIGDGNDPGTTQDEVWMAGYQFRHAFSDRLSFRQSVRYRHRDTTWDRLIRTDALEADQRTLQRYSTDQFSRTKQFTADTGIEVKFDTGALQHRTTMGVDFSHTTASRFSGLVDGITPLDLFAPANRGAAVVDMLASPAPSASKAQSLGFYIQDHITLTERLSVMIGGRYDQVDGGSALTRDPDDSRMIGGSAFVPNFGVSFAILPDLYAYANYSKAFKGQFSAMITGGGRADPEEGVNYEAGLKAALLDSRINATLSGYEMTRQNVLQPDLENPLPGFSLLSGEQRTRGLEFDSQLLLLPNWEVVASFAYTDAEVTASNQFLVGSALRSVPKHTAGVWSKYTFREGVLDGLGFSVGGTYYAKQGGIDVRASAPGNAFDLPSYVLLNMNLDYEWNRFRVSLGCNNLLDEEYYLGSNSVLQVLPGNPRHAYLKLVWSSK